MLVYGYTGYSGATLTATWRMPGSAPVSVHLQLGVPDASSATSTTHYLSIKPQFAPTTRRARARLRQRYVAPISRLAPRVDEIIAMAPA